MELIRASDTPSVAPVLEWHIEDVEPDRGSVTSRLTKESVAVFRRHMKKLPKEGEPTQETFRLLERSCSSLILWESGYGVAKGGLDDVLAKSRALRRSTLEHLVNISEVLADRLPPLLNPGDDILASHRALRSVAAEAKTSMHEGYQDGSDGDDSDSDSSASLSIDWDEVAEDLWTDVQCLLDLDGLIKSPAPDLVHHSLDSSQVPENWNPHVAFTDRIRFRFPSADAGLIDRLARANWARFLKGKDDREKNQNLGEAPVAEHTSVDGVENAATVAHHTEPVSKFHDSGLGTSINTGSAYAETVMSYRRDGGASVRIPPLPEEAKEGKPFECVACGGALRITNSSAWKKHLYLDLCPWICHDLSCKFGTELFATREDWVHHLGLEHGLYPDWRSLACPMCHEETGDGKLVITRHLSSHMEEISLAALPAGVETDDESESESESESTSAGDDGSGGISVKDEPEEVDDDDDFEEVEVVECRICNSADSRRTMLRCPSPIRPQHWFHDKCRPGRDTCGLCGAMDAMDMPVSLPSPTRTDADKNKRLEEMALEALGEGRAQHISGDTESPPGAVMLDYNKSIDLLSDMQGKESVCKDCKFRTCAYSRKGGKSFPRKDYLRRHMVNKHARIPPPDQEFDFVHVVAVSPKKGCLTCRRKRMLCDKAEPDCSNCVRAGALCEGNSEEPEIEMEGGRPKSPTQPQPAADLPNPDQLKPPTEPKPSYWSISKINGSPDLIRHRLGLDGKPYEWVA